MSETGFLFSRHAKDLLQSIKKLIGIRNQKIQLLALSLLETIVKDCGDIVHNHVAEEGVIHEMVEIVKKKPSSLVEKKILVLICTWQEAFGDRYPHYYAACQELLRAGLIFPGRSATLFTSTPTQPLTSNLPKTQEPVQEPSLNVEVGEMIYSDPWSLKQPIHVLGISFAFAAFFYALESLAIPSQGYLSTHLGFLVSGTCLFTWASTLSTSFAFYWICSHLSGLLMTSFLLLHQVVKRLPKKLSYSAVFLYLALIGLTVVSLPYIPGWFEFIRELAAFVRTFTNFGALCMVISIRFSETYLGLLSINSELLLANDGSIDIGISHVMSWFIRIWAAVLILQSSEDPRLAGGALVCVIVVSPLLRMITRFIFPQSLSRTLMAKLLIMRGAVRDAVGPSVWCLIMMEIYFLRLVEEFVRSYGKEVRKKMKKKVMERRKKETLEMQRMEEDLAVKHELMRLFKFTT